MTKDIEKPKKDAKTYTFNLILLIALVALALGGWNAYQGWQGQKIQAKSDNALERTMTGQQQLTDNLERVIQFQKTQQDILSAYTRSLERVVQKTQTDSTDLTLDEVAFLIRTAGYQLNWRQDMSSAKYLLNLADQRLQRSGMADGQVLRKELARVLTQLDAVPVVDRMGLLARLTALDEAAYRLTPLGNVPEFKFDVEPEVIESKNNATWRNVASKVWAELQRVVVVHKRDEPVEPLLSESAQQASLTCLQMLLQQAQLAVLSQREDLFKASLQTAKQRISAAYEPGESATQSFLAALTALESQPVAPTLPDMTTLERQVNQLIDKRAAATLKRAAQG